MSFEKLYPELIDLLEDEENEVSQDAFTSFGDHIAHLYRSPPFHETENESNKEENKEEEKKESPFKQTDAKIFGHEIVLKQFKETFKIFGSISEEKSEIMLERAPMLALIFNDPNDKELYVHLQELLSKWIPFEKAKAPIYQAEEYELQHAAYSMKYLSKLYKKNFLLEFYLPCFMKFIQN